MSLYDFIQKFGIKAHDFREEVSNFGEISDEERLNISNLVTPPLKYFVLTALTFGFYPMTILFRIFRNNGLKVSNTTKFLAQIEEIAIKANKKPIWTTKILANAIVTSYALFGVVFFAAGGIHAHQSNGDPMIYHAPPIIFISTIPLIFCVFLFVDTINRLAIIGASAKHWQLRLIEIIPVIVFLGFAFSFYKYGTSDYNSGLFSIFF